jgi:hypothetical protein
MRIGIITYHFSDNYGALIQAFALRHWFVSQGHQAEFINYQPNYVEEGGGFNFSKPVSKANLKILFLKFTYLKEKVFGDAGLKEGFKAFRRYQLGVASQRIISIDTLFVSGFDLLVCGSDQIWKPSEHYGIDPVYYLDFLTYGKSPRRISYAPSFGTDSLSPEFQGAIGVAIKKLDAISVREQTGCDIVERLLGKRPTCVPDPTLLLADYKQIMKPHPISLTKYVFCYALRSREVIGAVAEDLATKLDAGLYSPHNPHRRWREIGKTVYPCPGQWLDLLNSAAYVVTNSFHGTALSIILNKPFVVVGLQGAKAEFNARVKNLLALVDLEERFIQNMERGSVDSILSTDINWLAVNEKVDILRDTGVNYLQTEISHV